MIRTNYEDQIILFPDNKINEYMNNEFMAKKDINTLFQQLQDYQIIQPETFQEEQLTDFSICRINNIFISKKYDGFYFYTFSKTENISGTIYNLGPTIQIQKNININEKDISSQPLMLLNNIFKTKVNILYPDNLFEKLIENSFFIVNTSDKNKKYFDIVSVYLIPAEQELISENLSETNNLYQQLNSAEEINENIDLYDEISQKMLPEISELQKTFLQADSRFNTLILPEVIEE